MTDSIVRKRLLPAILLALAIIYWFIFDFLRWDMFDSPSFVGGARLLFNLEGGYNYQSRMSKPLVLVLPGLLEYLTGLYAGYSFMIQGFLAYLGSAFLLYQIFFILTRNAQIALGGVLAYIMCQPFAIFSFMILVDAEGWFVSLLIIYLTLKYFKEKPINWAHLITLGVLSSMGLLVKESAIFGLIFALFYVFFSLLRFPKTLAISLLILVGAFSLSFLASQLLTFWLFDDSIVFRTISQRTSVGFVFYDSTNIVQVFRALDFYWLLLIPSLMGARSFIRNYKLNKEAKVFAASVVSGLLLIPIYPFVVDRILFMVAPGVIFFLIMSKPLLGRFFLPLIIVGGIMNISISWLIYRYDTGGLLLLGLIIYSIFLILALWLRKANWIPALKIFNHG